MIWDLPKGPWLQGLEDGELLYDYDPSKIEWDLTNGPLSKLLELLDTQVFSRSVQWVLWEITWI